MYQTVHVDAHEARIIENADRLAIDPLHTALALELVTRRAWRARCCWCLEKDDPRGEMRVFRLRTPGDCPCCPYTGRDVLLVAPPLAA